jgi:hypothetical protein
MRKEDARRGVIGIGRIPDTGGMKLEAGGSLRRLLRYDSPGAEVTAGR